MLYYVNNNAQANGDHEVHVRSCNHFPGDTTGLGDHANCRTAVAAAKRIYAKSDGCFWCCRECHTR